MRQVPKAWNESSCLDALLSERALSVHRDVLQFGDHQPVWASATSMKSWPTPIEFGAFDALLSLPTEMVISHCFRVMTPDATLKHIASVKRNNVNRPGF